MDIWQDGIDVRMDRHEYWNSLVDGKGLKVVVFYWSKIACKIIGTQNL